MGTQLYSKGVFINKCFEQVNLENPALIKSVHLDYLKAGAEMIETNTFGANESRLAAFALQDQVAAINQAAVRAAKEAVNEFHQDQTQKDKSCKAWIAASIGPLAENTLPFGRLTMEESVQVYRSQIEALEKAGVDLFICETFTHLPQLEAAVSACRRFGSKPVIALVTLRDEGQTSLGESPEKIRECFQKIEADAVGFNCSSGPGIILEVLSKLKNQVDKTWAVFPNSGLPKNVYGRTLYMATPEYFANFVKKFAALGVKLIGGCCGTDARHIKRAHDAILAAPKSTLSISQIDRVLEFATKQEVRSPDRSQLSAKLTHQEFAVSVEIDPPRGSDFSKALEAAQKCFDAGVDCINIADGPRASARMDPASMAVIFQERIGIECIVHFCCRDRNLLGLQNDLLGAAALKIKNVLCITGDPPKLGDYPEATSVFDVDAIGLSKMVRALSAGFDLAGHSIGAGLGFFQGVGCNPGALNFELEMQRLEQKIEAGAEYVMTQPVYEAETFERFLKAFQGLRQKIPLLIGICPLASLRNAQFLHTEVPGMQIPESVLKRMGQFESTDDQRKVGIEIAREALKLFKADVQGTYVMPPFNRADTAIAVVEDYLVKGAYAHGSRS
jgi:methionine synthase I (cobalamin-dependent)/5,10-methylenetetrahydrofolate reductase